MMNKNIEDKIETAKAFEKIIEAHNEHSKKMAWTIAGVSSLLAVCSILAVVTLTPLKKTELAIVSVDKTTGRTELITQVKEEEIVQADALARYFVDKYIQLREGYNYPSLQSDYETVQLYSANAVKDDYLRLFDSEQAPDKIYNNNSSHVDIDIISNIISNATPPEKLSTVRFKKTTRNFKTGLVTTDFWTARITYRFEPSKKMQSSEREINPLGFIVTSYVAVKDVRGQ